MDPSQTVLKRPGATVTTRSLVLNLKPFGFGASLKEGEIVGDQ
jgi:hypothetical protein